MKKLGVVPLYDRVLVRLLKEDNFSKGGIVIPDVGKEKPQRGELVAVGIGRMENGARVPMEVKTGDKILFGKYTGAEITLEGETFLVMSEPEILARIE